MSSGIWLFEDVAAFIPGLSSGKVCFEDECSSNAFRSSQRVCFEDEREIPDLVGNDVCVIVLREMMFQGQVQFQQSAVLPETPF